MGFLSGAMTTGSNLRRGTHAPLPVCDERGRPVTSGRERVASGQGL
jgi:hypothetical protein